MITGMLRAADSLAIRWEFNHHRLNDSMVLISFRASIPSDCRLYGLKSDSNEVLFSDLHYDTAAAPFISRPLQEKGQALRMPDTALQTIATLYADSVYWQQLLKMPASDSLLLKGTISCLYRKSGAYLTEEKDFKIYIHAKAEEDASGSNAMHSLWWIFMSAFAGGLLALLTPCVYSMVPVTVSFFIKRSDSRRQGIRNALFYSGSIIAVFTGLGFFITLVFGPAVLNNLATNWIANLFFFLVFVLFGISFLGAFEIRLPASWSNSTGSKAAAGSLPGIFFMALTLVLVSFSCTGPIIGNLLVLAARGNYWGPLTGMLGFSTALALPFALFSFFPSRLQILGKAGGWLNAVKVSLGFLELALALKFLSNADLARGWRLLDRELFICIWVALFIMLTLYLLGKIRFHHDDALLTNDFGQGFLRIPRFLFAVMALCFSLYMIPGLWGAPLKGISAFLPPMGTQDFTIEMQHDSSLQHEEQTQKRMPHKYAEQMKIYEPEVVRQSGLITYFDLDEARAAAKEAHKPLMLDFTGINCVNCRKMETSVWSDPEVLRRLKDNFVIVSLYVDVQQIDLPEAAQYYSKALGKQVETLGDKNADYQVSHFAANSQPYYFFTDDAGQLLSPQGYGYNPDVNAFVQLLDNVKNRYDTEK